MALFFNMQNIEKESGSDVKRIFELLNVLYTKKLGVTRVKLNLIGTSFLLNPEPFIKDKRTDILYKLQYLKLAAMRGYTQYKEYGLKTLDLSFYPDLDRKLISSNPLLKIKNNQLHFLYED